MKTVFLTSAIGGYKKTKNGKVATNINNSNYFVDRLKAVKNKWNTLVFVCSDPDGYEKTEQYANIFLNAFNLDGFDIKNLHILDHKFTGDIEKTILSSDAVLLTGGHTPTQNKYLKEIGLDKILEKYDGIIIGQSAGSMNLATTVYCPPDCPEDLTDDYQKIFSGMGVTDIIISPHTALTFNDNVDGKGKNTIDYCIEDSYKFPIYAIYDSGFIEIKENKTTTFGKTLLIKNGQIAEICKDGESVDITNTKQNDLEK